MRTTPLTNNINFIARVCASAQNLILQWAGGWMGRGGGSISENNDKCKTSTPNKCKYIFSQVRRTSQRIRILTGTPYVTKGHIFIRMLQMNLVPEVQITEVHRRRRCRNRRCFGGVRGTKLNLHTNALTHQHRKFE